MYLAGSEAEPPSFHHFLIGSLGKCVQSVTCLSFSRSVDNDYEKKFGNGT